MILSDERFDALLSGDKPQNEMEAKWLKSFEEEEAAHLKKMVERDQKRLQEIEQAYREYYALIKSTFPKSFFYKHPISSDEYKKVQQYCFDTYGDRILKICESPILRTLNGLPPMHPSGDDYGAIHFLEERYFYRELEKRYKINLRFLSIRFEKYKTPEFMEKLEAIKTKYDERLLWSIFNEYDYLTDWQDYNV